MKHLDGKAAGSGYRKLDFAGMEAAGFGALGLQRRGQRRWKLQRVARDGHQPDHQCGRRCHDRPKSGAWSQ